MDTIRSRKACSSCLMVNPSPERKLSNEVVDEGSTLRNAPVTDLSGSLTPLRSDLAMEDTVDSQFDFFSSTAAFGSALSLGRTLGMSPEG